MPCPLTPATSIFNQVRCQGAEGDFAGICSFMQHHNNCSQIQGLFLLNQRDQELCHRQAHILLQVKWKNPTLARLAEVAPVSPGRRPSPPAPLSSREQALHRHAESGHALHWLHKYTTMTVQACNVLVLLPMNKMTHLPKIQCWAARKAP